MSQAGSANSSSEKKRERRRRARMTARTVSASTSGDGLLASLGLTAGLPGPVDKRASVAAMRPISSDNWQTRGVVLADVADVSIFGRAGERRGKSGHALGIIRVDQDLRRPTGQPGGHHVEQFDRRRGNDRSAAVLGHVVQTAKRKFERGVRILLAELEPGEAERRLPVQPIGRSLQRQRIHQAHTECSQGLLRPLAAPAIASEQESRLRMIIVDGHSRPDLLEFAHDAPSQDDVAKRTEQGLNIHQTGAMAV